MAKIPKKCRRQLAEMGLAGNELSMYMETVDEAKKALLRMSNMKNNLRQMKRNVRQDMRIIRGKYRRRATRERNLRPYRIVAIYIDNAIDDLSNSKEQIDEFIQKRRAQEQTKAPQQRMPIPDDVKMFVWRRDGGCCVKCGKQENLEYDHIIPVSKGGSNTARNLQLLCESCNRSKGGNLV